MHASIKQNRNRFFATFCLAAALLFPVLAAEANEGTSAPSLDAMKFGEVLDAYRAAPEPTPMQSGVYKCCEGYSSTGKPLNCVWKPLNSGCVDGKTPAWCPSEHSDPSNCTYVPQ